MNKKIEKEYKILVTKEQFDSLMCLYDDYEVIDQLNVYYDTCDGRMKELRGGMRIRSIGNRYIFTIKFKHPEGHLELEKEVSSDCIEDIMSDCEIQSWFHEYGLNFPLVEIGRLRTIRHLHRSEVAELCFDVNEYNGMIDYEIEYEYIKEHDGLTIFQQLLSHVNVVYKKNCISKIGRTLNSL